MIYLDTSVVVPLFLADAHSPRVAIWMSGLTGVTGSVSAWTIAEFSSAVAGQERTGQITLADRQAAETAFDGWVTTVQAAPVLAADFLAARQLIRTDRVRLRTPDALHIAVALRLGASVATLDQAMERAATDLGLTVEVI